MKSPSSASKLTRTKHRLFAISLLLTCLQAALTEIVLATTDGMSDTVNPAFPPNPPTSSGEDYIYYHYKFAGGAAGGVMCPGWCDEGDVTYMLNGLTSEYKEINSTEVLCRIGTESAYMFHGRFCAELEGGTTSFHCGPHVRLCSESDANDCPDESPQFGDCYQLTSNTYTGAGWTVIYTHPAYSNIPLCYYYDQKTCDYIMCPNIADGDIKCHSYNWGWSDYYEVQVWLDPGASIPGGGPAFAGALGLLGVPFAPNGVSVGFQAKCDCDDGNIPMTGQLALGRRVSAGASHTLAAKINGTVWAWGYGPQVGPCGGADAPVQITNLTGIIAVSAGWGHSLALRNDGTVWAWGVNDYGELGEGTTSTTVTPQQVQTLSNIVAVSAGLEQSYAIESNGVLWAWGSGGGGELGNGTWSDSSVPVHVTGLTNAVSVSAGNGFCLAVDSNHTVWGWGTAWAGQLGPSVSDGTNRPVVVTDLFAAAMVSAGGEHCLGLAIDGQVWAWGDNGYGQLGSGTTTSTNVANRVSLGPCVDIAAGGSHSLAVAADGTAFVWGWNSYGQLGDGTQVDRHSPVALANASAMISLSAGGAHSIGLVAEAGSTPPVLRSWGYNVDGQLGDGEIEEEEQLEPDFLYDNFGL
jgi:alpha-tubulin suppressor-like RCC1 family protein